MSKMSILDIKFIQQTNKVGIAICVFFAHLRIRVVRAPIKSRKNYRRYHLKKNVPKCSFAYLRICFRLEEITA